MTSQITMIMQVVNFQIKKEVIEMKRYLLLLISFTLFFCTEKNVEKITDVAAVAKGWQGEIVAKVDQSYAGWDVEIGDADNDGKNEILVTGSPDSKLFLFKKLDSQWHSTELAKNLAESFPGMGLVVKVVDLNNDGINEIILGTGQESGSTALFYVMQTDGIKITKKLFSRPEYNKSSFTHNLAFHDLDKDGLLEVISAYCSGGEIIRYDIDKEISRVKAEKLHQLSGSGEESIIADIDNDGEVEYITSNSFRADAAKVEIYEFDKNGNLIIPPRIVMDGYDGKRCFYASLIVGDVDNDGLNELIVGWKEKQKINKGTVIGYKVESEATHVYTFAYEDEDLDMSYFEKMMAVADADNDGKNELILSTRGDNMSELITSQHLGYVFQYKIDSNMEIHKMLLVDFNEEKVESSWLAVGDPDNDGKNEIILATGKGDRKKKGTSYVILIKKTN